MDEEQQAVDDVAYFERRAELETEQARKARNPEVAKIHRRMADLYRVEMRRRGGQAA